MGIFDILLPAKCLECAKVGNYLCLGCLARVRKPMLICCHCKKVSVGGVTHRGCKKKTSLDRVYSLWHYEKGIRKEILALKYKFALEIAKDLAQKAMQEITNNHIKISKNHILIPVPMHWYRRNWRGFNQSEEIGRFLANSLKVKWVPDIIKKSRITKAQAELSGKERSLNLIDSFTVNPKYGKSIKDKSIIVFDDVWTTGSTIKEIARILKQNGVKSIKALTLATSN